MVSHWCVVQTKAYNEEQAAAALAGKGLAVYLPRVKTRRVNPRARPMVPLFPGYLFVHLNFDLVAISAINWAPGVVRLVDFGDGPVVVPDEVIEHVKRRVAEGQEQAVAAAGAAAPGAGGAAAPSQIQVQIAPQPQQPSAAGKEYETLQAASVMVNPETGVMLVRATGRQHEKIQGFLDQVLSSARRQVMIEATIVEVRLNQNYQQGIDWLYLTRSTGVGQANKTRSFSYDPVSGGITASTVESSLPSAVAGSGKPI